MAHVAVHIEEFQPGDLKLADAILQIKRETLQIARDALIEAQQKIDFPKDPSQYQLLLRNRGAESRRQLHTIQPRFLRIPYRLTFVSAGSREILIEAAIDAWQVVYRQLSRRTGALKRSTTLLLNGAPIPGAALRLRPVEETDIFEVTTDIRYATPLEVGLIERRYNTPEARRNAGGAFNIAVKTLRRKWGKRGVAFAVAFRQHNGGTLPKLRIGMKGDFAENNLTISTLNRRRRARNRARRQARGI